MHIKITTSKKLTTAAKNKTGTTLRMSFKMLDRNGLPHELLLTTRQKTKPRNAIENNMSAEIKLSKAHISKIKQSDGFLGSLLSKLEGPLMKVAVPLARNILAPLGITAAASAIDSGIQKKKLKKIHGSGATTLIISNEEMHDIMKIVQALEDSNILLKRVTKTIRKETKEQKRGFLGMLLGNFGVSLLGNMLAGKVIVRADFGNKKAKGIVRAGYGNKTLILPHPLTKFEIQMYYQIEIRFNGVYSRNNLP